jgi:hypothetical protein
MEIFKNTLVGPYRLKRLGASMSSGGLIGFPLGCWFSSISVGGQMLLQTVFSTIMCKFVFVASGLQAGWSLGNQWWSERNCIEEMIRDPAIWKILNNNIPTIPQEEGREGKEGKEGREDKPDIYDKSSPVGSLYHMCLIVFLERFHYHQMEEGSIKTKISLDYHQLIRLLELKVPSISKKQWEQYVYSDTYPYIYSSYWMEQQIKDVQETALTRDVEDESKLSSMIYQRIKPIIEKLTQVQHPQLKFEVLKHIVDEVVHLYHLQSWKLPSCEDIMPIICAILIKFSQEKNKQLPIVDIYMVYDYFGSYFDEKGYISTLWMSALHKVNPTSAVLLEASSGQI